MPSRNLAIPLTLLAAALMPVVQLIFELPLQFRFGHLVTNHVAVALVMVLIPTLIFWTSVFVQYKWLRRSGICVAVLLSIPCLLISGFVIFTAPKQYEIADSSFELLDEIQNGSVVYRLYRTDCGATCAYGLNLRAERGLLLGTKLVSPLWSLDRADKGTLVITGPTVQIIDGSNVLGEISR